MRDREKRGREEGRGGERERERARARAPEGVTPPLHPSLPHTDPCISTICKSA